jgi:Mg2+ and Co2+ transporter CorA
MGGIFEKYIPKFNYELVDLNKYSREELIKYGNALSLILLIDKIRWAEDIELSTSVPEDYLEYLSKNIPEPLLPLISDCVRVFLKHIEAPEEEIERISEKIYARRLNEMFYMVDGYSVKKTREQAKIEATLEATEKAKKEFEKKAHAEKLEMVKEMLLDGKPMNEIMKYSKWTEEAINKVKEAL